MIFTENRYYFKFLQFWVHLVPAYIVDLICLCLGKQRRCVFSCTNFFTLSIFRFVKMYQKLHRICDLVGFFNVNLWKYETSNCEIMWKALKEKDRELFPFDMEEFQWKSYLRSCTIYGRTHLLKDPMDTLPQAKRKQKLILFLYCCIAFVLVFVLWCLI